MSPSPPTKVSGRRYLAYVIDALIRVAAGVVPFVLLAERLTVARLAERDPSFNADNVKEYSTFASQGLRAIRIDDRVFLLERNEVVIVAAIALGVALFFDVIVQGRAGWTIGKALAGLRTVNKDGERPGIFRALVRTILLPIDLIPSYLFPVVGGLIIFASDSNRRLGDLVAGTFVVDKEAWGQDPRGEEERIDTSPWESLDEHPGHVKTLAEGEALRVGEQAVSEPAPAPEAEPSEKAPAYQPQWDPARKAYLQWDPRKETWLQFDDDAGEWRPI